VNLFVEYGQWIVLVISVFAIAFLASVDSELRLRGYILTATARFLGGLIFVFTDLWALAIANTIYVVISIRGYQNNKNFKRSNNVMWEYWCKAIGEKAYDDNNKADRVAMLRTGWVVLHIFACLAIIANAIANHGWGLVGL